MGSSGSAHPVKIVVSVLLTLSILALSGVGYLVAKQQKSPNREPGGSPSARASIGPDGRAFLRLPPAPSGGGWSLWLVTPTPMTQSSAESVVGFRRCWSPHPLLVLTPESPTPGYSNFRGVLPDPEGYPRWVRLSRPRGHRQGHTCVVDFHSDVPPASEVWAVFGLTPLDVAVVQVERLLDPTYPAPLPVGAPAPKRVLVRRRPAPRRGSR